MQRPFLFMSGEFRVTMPAVFLRDAWQHTMSPERLVADPFLRRNRFVSEKLDGAIFYADVDDKDLERENLELLCNFSCWPNPRMLLLMLDRHRVMKRCIDACLVDHDVIQSTYDEFKNMHVDVPYVVKEGNSHRGIGKHLVTDHAACPTWDGIATIEPFFLGSSVRVLLLGDAAFCINVENSSSWIKNASGAEVTLIDLQQAMIEHARNVVEEFGLDVAGVDYIKESSGKFHFLEINQYPGLDVSDEVDVVAKAFLNEKMDFVERFAQ